MHISLNADLGESPARWASGEDVALLDVVTSANVCCGAYAGDDELISATCAACVERGVAIGAQVGYPDREGFGRVPMDMEPQALRDEVAAQIAHLIDLAGSVGGRVTYVKPHGALYSTIVHDEVQAAAVVVAVHAAALPLVGLPKAASLRLARAAGVPVILEGFADRGYTDEGTLIPRSEPGALLDDPGDAAVQALRLLHEGVASICVHSDSPRALDLVRAVRVALEYAGAEVRHP
ncbi:5-oxoprolinase subunit PxpA [Aeromicrobium sp.]|uniref:5-oxoprolinase subunit PxpA n=1 Tax=Aeromicrobium sp. TaxID=1871063 RepID=UPI003D6BE02C